MLSLSPSPHSLIPSLSHSRHQLRCVLGLRERGRLKQNQMCFSPVCNNRQQLFTSQWPSSWSRFLCPIPSSPRCSPHTERRHPDLLFRNEEARLYSGSGWASESPSAHRVSVQCQDGPLTRFLLSSLPVLFSPRQATCAAAPLTMSFCPHQKSYELSSLSAKMGSALGNVHLCSKPFLVEKILPVTKKVIDDLHICIYL